MSSAPSCPLVLLIEDSEDDAYFFQRTLKKSCQPCEVIHLANGAEAMRYFQALAAGGANAPRRPDFVFLDLKLPVFGGFEILERVDVRAFTPPLDVAILSGSPHESDIAMAKTLGATAYFVKPITREQLETRLGSARATAPAPAAHPTPQPA
jgi:CheY-like chemotaxis protein